MEVKSCRVTISDMEGVAHTVEVTAATLYEAVALAERVGYSIKPLSYLVMFSAICAKTAWRLGISAISPVSTASPVSSVWV